MPIEWIDFGKKYRIKNHMTVKGGFYIYTGQKEDMKNHPAYPFAIDISRDVHIRQKGYNSFHFWHDMTPDMRYDYIRWLSDEIPVVELDSSLFYYYLHGICHRLFLDSSLEEKRLLQNCVEWMYTEYSELKFTLSSQLRQAEIRLFMIFNDSLHSAWLGLYDNVFQTMKPDKIDEEINREITGKKDIEFEIERLKAYLHKITDYVEILDSMRMTAYFKYICDDIDYNPYERLLQLSGEKYDEDEIYELRAFIPDIMSAGQAYALAIHLGMIDMFSTTRLRLGTYENFVRMFNRIYPVGLAVTAYKPITDIILPMHTSDSLYQCMPYRVHFGGDLFENLFNADMLYDELLKVINRCNENVDEDFWAYSNAIERSKGIITLYSLLCLPVEYDLMNPDIKTFFNIYFDILFQDEKCVCVAFKQFLQMLGYRFNGFEDRLKYYKAYRLVQGLAQFGVRIYMDMTSIETGEVAQGRSLKFDVPCTIWRISGRDRNILDKGYFDGFKRICVFILDSGSDRTDIQIIHEFICKCNSYNYRMAMRAVLNLYMQRKRKYDRKVWKEQDYRNEVRKKLQIMLDNLSTLVETDKG